MRPTHGRPAEKIAAASCEELGYGPSSARRGLQTGLMTRVIGTFLTNKDVLTNKRREERQSESERGRGVVVPPRRWID